MRHGRVKSTVQEVLCHDGSMSDPPSGSRRGVIEPGTVEAPEFPPGLDWINAERPLTIRQLRGKIVLLDFWTYCCINCMHVLEDLKRLEAKYRDELVVIGVHSAKFDAEKETGRIREAVLRNGIAHPVVNDLEMQIWRSYGIRAWPSFILIDPLGKVFGTHSGERVFDLFDRVISQMVRHYEPRGEMHGGPLETRTDSEKEPHSVLSFPGKVLADQDGGRLFIADTNHHRIVVADLDDGTVLDVIGSGEQGFLNGVTSDARFSQPQGMALLAETLFVADTGNHAVRRVDLSSGIVSSLVGDGHQDLEWNNVPGPLEGRRLNSPWDLQIAHGVLFVAMAGSHQIFGIDLEGGYIAGHAGSGQEDHVDGPLLAAAMAQPSGLTSDGENLFVADSEISSVRAVSLDPRGGHVRTVVGKGLFDFGDLDGVGQDVRLQHPMGVALARGALYVADTYNNKIKTIGLPTLSTRTIAGTGGAGQVDGPGDRAMFNEPCGLSCARGLLFVADTNNHSIRKVDLATGNVSTLHLRNVGRLIPPPSPARTLPPRPVRAGSVTVSVRFDLPSGCLVSPGASSGLTLRTGDRVYPVAFRDGRGEASVDVFKDELLRVEAVVYYCTEQRPGACFYMRETKTLPLRIDPAGSNEVALRLGGSGSHRRPDTLGWTD